MFLSPLTRTLCLIGLSASLIGCASLDVDPCSREGIERRVKDSFAEFARDNRGDLNEMRQASRFFGGETTFGAMRIANAAKALERLVDDFQDDVVPELRAIENQCGQAEPMRELFIEFLEDEGIDDRVLDWVDSFSILLIKDEAAPST